MNAMINRYLKLSRRSRSTGECSSQLRAAREQNNTGIAAKDSNSECNMSMDSSSGSDSCFTGGHCNSISVPLGPTTRMIGSLLEGETQQVHDHDVQCCMNKFVMEDDPVSQMIQYFQQKGGRYERDEVLERLVHLRMECADAYGSQEVEPEDSWCSHAIADASDRLSREATCGGSASLSDSEAQGGVDYKRRSVEVMLSRLRREGMDAQVLWLQKQLLEYTHVKLSE